MAEILYEDGSKYVGDVVDGKRHGQGYLTFSSNVLTLMKEWDELGNADFSDHWSDPRGISTPANTGDVDDINSVLLAEYNKQSTTWSENYAYIGAWENDFFHGIGTRCWIASKGGYNYGVTKHISTFNDGARIGFGRKFLMTKNPRYDVCTTHSDCGPDCNSKCNKLSVFGVFQNDKGNGVGFTRNHTSYISGIWKNGTWSDTDQVTFTWRKKTSWGATATFTGILLPHGWPNENEAPTNTGGTITTLGIFPNPMTINFSDGSTFEGEYNFDTGQGNGTLTMPGGYTYTGDVNSTGDCYKGNRQEGQIFEGFKYASSIGYKLKG